MRVLALTLALASATPLAAQTWQGFTIGAPIPETMPEGQPPAPKQHERWTAYCDHRWIDDLPDNLFLRAVNTVGCDGPVATIFASAMMSAPDATPMGYKDFILGRTTLSEVQSALGSGGLTGAGYGNRAEGALDYVLLYDIAGTDTRILFNFLATDVTNTSTDLVARDEAWLQSVEMMTRDYFAIRTRAFPFSPSAGYSAIPDTFE